MDYSEVAIALKIMDYHKLINFMKAKIEHVQYVNNKYYGGASDEYGLLHSLYDTYLYNEPEVLKHGDVYFDDSSSDVAIVIIHFPSIEWTPVEDDDISNHIITFLLNNNMDYIIYSTDDYGDYTTRTPNSHGSEAFYTKSSELLDIRLDADIVLSPDLTRYNQAEQDMLDANLDMCNRITQYHKPTCYIKPE